MTVILESVVGSTAYGLNTANSDIDRLGIYIEPTINFSGLDLKTEKDFSRVQTQPDRTLHELGKFCRLALQCNPTILELLWVPQDLLVTLTEDGRQLRDRRFMFISAKQVHSSFMGYATSQFKRLTERGDFGSDTRNRREKHARHLLRLMHQGYTLYSTGNLPIRLEDPEKYHEFGRAAVEDPSIADKAVRDYASLFEHSKSKLPEEPARGAVDIWLKSIRKKY